MKESIKIIGFDADDTLWVNEPNYQETEKQYCRILSPYIQGTECSMELFKTEMQNLALYGYGGKGFMLSMIETALRVTDNRITNSEIKDILEIGKNLLNQPVELLPGVETVLRKLKPDYLLILATKGDLLDQERKLSNSGLSEYFHHIEIMSDKQEANYRKLISHLEIKPEQFVMIGNSIKSDILPVLNIGAKAIHIPFEVTWLHEKTHEQTDNSKFITINSLTDVLKIL